MSHQIKISNGKIITTQRIIPNGTIVLSGEKILEVSERDVDVPGAVEIDARGNYIAPGFIDIHVHGGGGYDFMDATEEAFFESGRNACAIRYYRDVAYNALQY